MKKIFSIVFAMLAVTTMAFAESKTVNCGTEVQITATPETGYHFVRWNDNNTNNPRTVEVTEDMNFIAYFDINTYSIRFMNGEEVLQALTVNHGIVPEYTGSTPTKASTAQYNYSFSGWQIAPYAADKDQDYIAQFEAILRQYTIRFLNEDGSEITSNLVNYGATPVAPEEPTKASTAQYNYVFAGWGDEIAAVSGDKDYQAVFTPVLRKYNVVFKDYDGSIIDSGSYDYGTSLSDIMPANPTRANEGCTAYTFNNWGRPVPATVNGELEFTASYTSSIIQYTITVESEDTNKGSVSISE